jgi:autotransporter translocation and assembly factor TamB
MRFGKQRLVIALLFLALPFVTLSAFIQTPYVSEFVLSFSLRLVQFRTGLRFKASSWVVEPIAFSAALTDIEFRHKKIRLSADELRVEVSPLSLIFGRIHLTQVALRSARVTGRLDSQVTSDSKDQSLKIEEVANTMGRGLTQLTERLRTRHISFDRLSVEDLDLNLDQISCNDSNVAIENYDSGQARAEWHVRDLHLKQFLAPIGVIDGAAALLRSSEKNYSLVVTQLKVHGNDDGAFDLRVSGQLPGDMRVQAESKLESLLIWIKNSPELKGDVALRRLSGTLETDSNLEIGAKGLSLSRTSLKLGNFVIDDNLIDSAHILAKGDVNSFEISKLELLVPHAIGDNQNWRHRIHSNQIVIKKNSIEGSLKLDQVGLCGILKGSGVVDCFVRMPIDGDIAFVGSLSPFELVAKPKLNFEFSEVRSTPFAQADADSELVALTAGGLSGLVTVRAKNLDLQPAELEWADGSKIETRGRIDYLPAIVSLQATTNNTRWEKVFTRFIGQKISGLSRMEAKINYSSLIPFEQGQTTVTGRINMDGFGFEGQTFGSLVGPVKYSQRKLELGSFSLVNGGGRARIEGLLDPTLPATQLSLRAKLDRIEAIGRAPTSGSEIFRGFVSGQVELVGSPSSKSPDFLSGPLKLELSNFRVFNVPFQTGMVQANYRKGQLEVRSALARRTEGEVRLSGVLKPEGGSELRFASTEIPIRVLEFDPGLDVLNQGKIVVDGWWKPATGWSLFGDLKDVEIAGVTLGNGQLKLAGTDTLFQVQAELGPSLNLFYQADTTETVQRPVALRAEVKDLGLYALFAYLKGWKEKAPVQCQGSILVDWTRDAGLVTTRNVVIKGPAGSRLEQVELLQLSGDRSFSWSNSKLTRNDFQDPQLPLQMIGAVGQSKIQIKLDTSVALLDLLVPNVQLLNGRLTGLGQLPLPPALDTMNLKGQVQNASFLIRGVGQPVTQAQGAFDLSRGRLFVQNLGGLLGSGDVKLNGSYRIDQADAGVSLQISLNRGHVVIMDDVPADVSGEISLRGAGRPYLLSGRVTAQQALFSKDFQKTDELVETETDPLLKYNLEVEMGSNVLVKNSLVSTAIAGRLVVTGTDVVPEIQGKVTLNSGTIIANENQFQIIQGQVYFPGGVPGTPVVNLQANSTLRYSNVDYRIDVKARGPADNMNIEFSSDPALSTQDILELLAFGVIRGNIDQTSASGSGDLVGAAQVEAFQALFGKVIGSNLDRTTGFQVKFKTAPDIAQKEFIPKVTIVRKLSDRMTATFGRSLDFNKPENNFQVDYRLLNNVNLTGVWEEGFQSESSQPNTSSLGVDLRFRFDIK